MGLVTGACLAELGNNVTCVDIDEHRVKKLQQNQTPFFEPGLQGLLEKNQERLTFTTTIEEAIQQSTVLFTAVGTPPGENHEADLSAVFAVAKSIGKSMKDYKVIVTKSTVPVGTSERVEKIIQENQSQPIPFDLVSNPEFLREGSAVQDFMQPDRVVVGTNSKKARQLMKELYNPITNTNQPLFFTDIPSAEIIKYASNAMLATRISFINEISQLCEKTNADITVVSKAMGLDKRIGKLFLQAGIGFGGSCFPKDVVALHETMKAHHIQGSMLEAVRQVNEFQKNSVVPKLKRFIPILEGKKIALWGLAFKPNTDDLREASSLVIIEQLLKEKAKVIAFDPIVKSNNSNIEKIEYASTAEEAITNADALVVVTEWDVFKNFDISKIKKLLKNPIIIDGRNIFNPTKMKKLGFDYQGIGR